MARLTLYRDQAQVLALGDHGMALQASLIFALARSQRMKGLGVWTFFPAIIGLLVASSTSVGPDIIAVGSPSCPQRDLPWPAQESAEHQACTKQALQASLRHTTKNMLSLAHAPLRVIPTLISMHFALSRPSL